MEATRPIAPRPAARVKKEFVAAVARQVTPEPKKKMIIMPRRLHLSPSQPEGKEPRPINT